jgi:hypothetical protein
MSKFHALDAKRKGDGFPRREMRSLFSVYSTTALGLFVALTSRLAASNFQDERIAFTSRIILPA